MAHRRKRGRPRKAGARTGSGRLIPAVDHSPVELRRKRAAAVNRNPDLTLSATPVGILYAHDHLSRAQLEAALRVRNARHAVYGAPFACRDQDRPAASEDRQRILLDFIECWQTMAAGPDGLLERRKPETAAKFTRS